MHKNESHRAGYASSSAEPRNLERLLSLSYRNIHAFNMRNDVVYHVSIRWMKINYREKQTPTSLHSTRLKTTLKVAL